MRSYATTALLFALWALARAAELAGRRRVAYRLRDDVDARWYDATSRGLRVRHPKPSRAASYERLFKALAASPYEAPPPRLPRLPGPDDWDA